MDSESPNVSPAKVRHMTCGSGVLLELVWIPPGVFVMGSPDWEEGRLSHEGPQRDVTVSPGFWMGRYPVTQAQYEAAMGQNPSHFKAGKGSPARPVERVSFHDAKAFCDSLNRRLEEAVPEQSSDAFWHPTPIACVRLPSEAEWEYACRAGSASALYNGQELVLSGKAQNPLIDLAWYRDNSEGATHPVGEKQPNAWGLYDMLGNVWEWCEDHWHNNYSRAPADSAPWVSSKGGGKVGRGGSWCVNAATCRSASRNFFGISVRDRDIGFRVVAETCTPDEEG